MKKNLLKYLLKPCSSCICFSLCLFIFSSQINSQTVSVQGRISASRFPVKNALVTFIDETDTTNKMSVLTDASGNYKISVLTSVESDQLPTKFALEQSYPNPFNSSAAIPYQLKKESNVQVTIYDILGSEVRKFNVGLQTVGVHNVLWDGRNNFGQRITSGIYFYRLQADGESQVKKMIFNEGGKGLVPLPGMYSPKINLAKRQNIEAGYYTIRVENTDNTAPLVVSQQLDNILLRKDTTINVTVNYTAVADIDLDSLHQIIRGFGAANIIPWRPAMTDSEIETAFGTGDGQLGFSMLRLMVQPDSNQWSMNLPVAKKAHDMGVLIFASPWDPPSSMIETVNGQKSLRHEMYDEYVAHLNAYNSFMAKNGVPLYAISVQNEPDYGDWTRWTPSEMFTFMKENAGNIENRVIAPESFQFRREMSDPILNDSLACSHLGIVGGHIYGGGVSKYSLAEQKGKEVWMTEHYTESSHSANVWSLAIDVASELQNVMKADMNAYVWWYIVRFYGPIGDGEKSNSYPNEEYAKKGEVTKRGYIMSQFSRFIRPGYYRVECNVSPSLLGGSGGVSVTAYKNPETSKVVIVAVNTSTSSKEQVFRIQNGAFETTFTPYTTSETKNCEKGEDLTITGSDFTLTIEPLSITTFISN